MSLRPDRPRCVALAARVSAACALLSCARLRAPQDRSRALLHVWPLSWRLSISTIRALHEYGRLVGREWRSEERGRAVGAVCSTGHCTCYFDR